MARKPRILADRQAYHLISRGNNGLEIFSREDGFHYFRELLRLSKSRFDWKLYHYCLMPNHFHLIGEPAAGAELPKLMSYLLSHYSRWYRYQTGYRGHLWAGRYKSLLIDKENYMLQCARYIERNPIKAKLSSTPESYTWSSYRFYVTGADDCLVDEDPNFTVFGKSLKERRLNYRDFIGAG